MPEIPVIRHEIQINAPTGRVWDTLTVSELIHQWMLDTPLLFLTEWREQGNVLIRGDLHGLPFENRGKVLRFEPCQVLEYTHWSTLSLIADIPENYSVLHFELRPQQDQTLLILTIREFLTFEIFKHLQFYWNTALHLLKEVAESREPLSGM
nr:SRPBCC domain-containing protein [uncultured Dyadobacter sp.]